jgi:hypothetical protein
MELDLAVIDSFLAKHAENRFCYLASPLWSGSISIGSYRNQGAGSICTMGS